MGVDVTRGDAGELGDISVGESGDNAGELGTSVGVRLGETQANKKIWNKITLPSRIELRTFISWFSLIPGEQLSIHTCDGNDIPELAL